MSNKNPLLTQRIFRTERGNLPQSPRNTTHFFPSSPQSAPLFHLRQLRLPTLPGINLQSQPVHSDADFAPPVFPIRASRGRTASRHEFPEREDGSVLGTHHLSSLGSKKGGTGNARRGVLRRGYWRRGEERDVSAGGYEREVGYAGFETAGCRILWERYGLCFVGSFAGWYRYDFGALICWVVDVV